MTKNSPSQWEAAYRHRFIARAISRGWARENAEVWAAEISGHALMAADSRGRACPCAMADADVIECEWEGADV